MQMVRHKDIDRTTQSFARGGMEQKLTEVEVKMVIQPAPSAAFESDSPLDNGKPAIEFRAEPW